MCTMRNNLFYILIICVYTNSFAKNERKESLKKDAFKLTREYIDEEEGKYVESLLSNVKNRNKSEEDEDNTRTMNIYAPRNINEQKDILMDKLDEILIKRNTRNVTKGSFRSNDQFYDDNSNHGRDDLIKNLPLTLRNVVKSRADVLKSDINNRFPQFMNKLASSYSNRYGKSVSDNVKYPNKNFVLRSLVNYVNLKPEVYPILLISEDKYGANGKNIGDLYYSNGEHEFTNVENKLVTKHGGKTGNYETGMRTSHGSMSKTLNQLNELLKQLSTNHGKKVYAKTADHLRTSDRLKNNKNNLQEFENKMALKDRDKRKTDITVLRTDVTDKMNSDINEQIDEFMKNVDIENLRIFTVPYSKRPAKQRGHGNRMKRSTITQAGYTQNPDTCKTYNENLIKLWFNLSKYIYVTEQPNERALHNIALMIQAYLEHQNTKQPPETYKVKHEGSRGKIGEIISKIRKILDEAEGVAEKITYTITKYLKPFYGVVESADCQQINEEYLSSSVELLYKNYLENAECHGDGDNTVRKRESSLRKQTDKIEKALSRHTTLSLANSDYRPEIQTIIIGNELYSDYRRGKMQRQKPTTKYKRVYKQNRKQRSRPVTLRSGNENQKGREKLKIRSIESPKSIHRKLKTSSRKSDSAKSRCEKYATRKLIVSLRPVIERFMGLLECENDNTLRSVNFGRVSKNPYYLYASKFYSNEDSGRHRKKMPRVKLTRKNKGRSRNKPHIKRYHDTLVENDQDGFVRDDETGSAWVRKYSLDQATGMNSVSSAITSNTDARESNTNNNNQTSNDYLTTYNEYLQSLPLYDDYDGIHKAHHLTNSNGFPSFINPLFYLNDKKSTGDKANIKNSASSKKERANKNVRNNEYNTFYGEGFLEEPNYTFNISDQQTDTINKEFPLIDLTNDDNSIEAKSKTHVKNFESITKFLKRARDASLQTPEIAVPFALDGNKGYVELTHLVKYPKILVYRPQFLVKNTIPYDDFLKTINHFNMTNDEIRLMKIVRYLPDSSVKVLFETEDFEAPLEVKNLNDNERKSGSPDPAVNYQLEYLIDTANENTNVDFTDGSIKTFVPIYHSEVRSNVVDASVKPDISDSYEDISASNLEFDPNSDIWRHIEEVSPNLNFNSGSDTIRHIEELSPKLDYNSDLNTLRQKEELSPSVDFDSNSNTNITSNSKPNSTSDSSSSLEFSSLPSLASKQLSTIPRLGSGENLSSVVGSAVGSQIGSGIGTGLDTALNLSSDIKLNTLHSSNISLELNKLLPSYSNNLSISNPHPTLNSQSHVSHSDSPSSAHSLTNSVFNSHSQLNSHSASLSNSNSGSHSLLPSIANKNVKVGILSSSTPSIVLRWWKNWKDIVKGKMKKIIGKMATFADKIDHIVKL